MSKTTPPPALEPETPDEIAETAAPDVREAPPRTAEHGLQDAAAHGDFDVPAPLDQVRTDVGRVAQFFRAIHSRYLWVGIALYVVTGVVGTVIAAATPLRDWYMHGFMYLVVFVFLMFYVRAHQLRRPIATAFYAVATLGLVTLCGWVLHDLVPPRLEVVDGFIPRAAGGAVPGPVVVERPEADGLVVPIVLLGACGAWLVFHWAVLIRYHHHPEDAEP